MVKSFFATLLSGTLSLPLFPLAAPNLLSASTDLPIQVLHTHEIT